MANTGKRKPTRVPKRAAAKKAAAKKGKSTAARKQNLNKAAAKSPKAATTVKRTSTKKKASPAARKTKNNKSKEALAPEIKLLVLLIISGIILFSLLGFAGTIGSYISYAFFGIFGWFAFIVPVLLFLGGTFYIANHGRWVAVVKLLEVFGMFASILALMTLADPSFDGLGQVTEGFLSSASSHDGGGIIGYALAWVVFRGFGRIASIFIFMVVFAIMLVLITGKRIFIRIGRVFLGEFRKIGRSIAAFAEDQAKERERQKLEGKHNPEDSIEEDDEILDSKMNEKLPQNDEDEDLITLESFSKEKLDTYDKGEKIPIQMPKFLKKVLDSSSETSSIEESDSDEDGGSQANEQLSNVPAEPSADTVKISGLVHEQNSFDEDISDEDLDASDNDLLEEEKEVQPSKLPEIQEAPVEDVKSEVPSEKEQLDIGIQETEVQKYEFPSIELLDKGTTNNANQSEESLRQTAAKLEDVLKSFGVGVRVTHISCGPAVTRYELQPDHGVKVSKIVNLADDIKLNLAVADIRIEAPIPGKAAVGIEVPNSQRQMVHFRDVLESNAAKKSESKLAFTVGKDIAGTDMIADIEKMPHLLIAGATGSGKSVCINTIIMSILYRADPNEVKMIMIDPKVVELNVYNGLPHLLIPVVTDPKKAAGALNWAVTTMMERYNKFAEVGAKDLKSYNKKVETIQKQGLDSEKHKKMPQIVIIIDELADLMMVAQSEVEDAICRLAQLARAAGIHLVIATQRPSVNVITGLIKANVPSRIAFSVTSGVDSRTILDMNGAEKLLGNGDMLYYPQGYQKPVRVQGAFVSESEITRVTDFIREHMETAPVYSEAIAQSIETSASAFSSATTVNAENDVYFEEAGRFVIEKEKASIGMLQRAFKIGFNRAARIMDQLFAAGVVGPDLGTKPRNVLMTFEEFEQYLKDNPS